MKLPAVLLITITYSAFALPAQAGISNSVRASSRSGNGGNSTTQVYINNNINTGSNVSSYRSKTTTDVHISQEGEGTSQVTINGKEWKLEGPGEINVSETSDSNPTPTTGQDPTSTPTETPTTTPKPTPDVLGDTDETPGSIGEAIQNFFKTLQQLISGLFK